MNKDQTGVVLPGRVYVHHGGGRYLVVGISEESTNARVGTLGVVYVSLSNGTYKHRELAEFTEIVTWPDGTQRPRFALE